MQWQQIKDFEEYEVSSTGMVRHGNRLLKTGINAAGYPQVSLCLNGKHKVYQVHRLVAEAFLPNDDNLPVVRHLDDDKTNNTVYNLCWGTYSDNILDAKSNGIIRGRAVLQYRDDILIREFASLAEAAKSIGLANPSNGGASHIKSVCEGKRKTLKGFTFKYKKEGDSYQVE